HHACRTREYVSPEYVSPEYVSPKYVSPGRRVAAPVERLSHPRPSAPRGPGCAGLRRSPPDRVGHHAAPAPRGEPDRRAADRLGQRAPARALPAAVQPARAIPDGPAGPRCVPGAPGALRVLGARRVAAPRGAASADAMAHGNGP